MYFIHVPDDETPFMITNILFPVGSLSDPHTHTVCMCIHIFIYLHISPYIYGLISSMMTGVVTINLTLLDVSKIAVGYMKPHLLHL